MAIQAIQSRREKSERKVTRNYAEYLRDSHQGTGPLCLCQSKKVCLNS